MSRVAILKTVPFKREQENIIGFSSRSAQQQYFADLAGKSSFDELFVGIGERNFLPSTDTIATLRIDLKSYPTPFNTIEALNCQYAIVNYEYASGSSNWGSGYLFYFITYAKSVNMNTIEYTLELDVFNTYLRGIDWDLPLTLYIDRAHLLRYNYVNNELQPFFRDYWYNSEGIQPPTYIKKSTDINYGTTLYTPIYWIYMIVKTSVPGYNIDNVSMQGSERKDQATGHTIYHDDLNATAIYSPYVVLWLPLSATIMFKGNNNGLPSSVSSVSAFRYAQEYLSPNIVGVFVSEIEPKNLGLPADYEYTTTTSYVTVNISDSTKVVFKNVDNKINVVGLMSYNIYLNETNFNYSIDNVYTNPKKYSEYIGDIKENLYKNLVVSCNGVSREYNILKLQENNIILTNRATISDSGVVQSFSINSGLYSKNGESGDVFVVNRKMENPSLSDSYQNWIANNKQYGITGYLVPSFKAPIVGAITGASVGGVHGAAIGALGGALSGLFNYINASANEQNEVTKPDNLNKGSYDALSSVCRYGSLFSKIIETEIEPTVKKEIDTLFLKYGYAVNMELSLGMLYTRYKYNYVKTGENISDRIRVLNATISNPILNIISDKFLYGVREWNSSYVDDINNPFNYGHGGTNIVENWEQQVFDSLPE